MNIAFCLFKYFPYGGLQRDMVAIAGELAARGHHIICLADQWQGEKPEQIEVIELPAKGFSNHRRNFRAWCHFRDYLAANPVDLVVGFNKMPGLDVYYAADSCFKAKVYEERGFISRLLPRSKHFIAFEEAVFGAQSHTRSLMISKPEIDSYQHYYHTPDARLTLLPPGIRRDRCAPDDLAQRRQALRQQMGIKEQEHILLMVGSGFKTKGLDRAIEGLASLPSALQNNTRLWVVGDDKAAPYKALAKRLGVAERVEFLGARDNVPDYLWAADLLVHPAYRENTGTILLEAAVAGLPVLTTAACGYASYIREFTLGVVVEAPFEQSVYNQQLAAMLVSEQRQQWQQNGIAFGRRENIFSMPAVAADCIEAWSS